MSTITIPKNLLLLTVVVFVAFIIQSSEEVKRRAESVEINDDNWSNLLKGEWLVDFHAPWCPACQKLKPEWEKLVDWSNDLNIKVASADVTKFPGLSGRFMVSGLPTVYHVKDGLFRVYNGPRTHTALINFVEDQGWKNIEPVSRFWAPDTLQMSTVAGLFRVSMALRDVHSHLTDRYGLPYYVSYAIFALCTVMVGTLLGLLIVFVVDLFIPGRYSERQQQTEEPEQGQSGAKKTKKGKKHESDSDDTSVSSEVKDKKSLQPGSSAVRRRAN